MQNNYDKLIIDKIENRMANDDSFWDFRNNHHKDHVHGLITYPATMVPKMQAEILDILLSVDKEISNIFDPFMGSGTILVEGMIRNLDIYGIDINPLAYLVTTVKTTLLPIDRLQESTEQLLNRIYETTNYPIIYFEKINKWFKDDIINDLSKIHYSIIQERDLDIRKFFWVAFGEIVRLCNNSNNSTFKLHIKKREDIENFKYDSIDEFIKKVNNNILRTSQFINIIKNNIKVYNRKISYCKKTKILLGDNLKLISDGRKFKTNSIDLIITSPPYGDNQTTVTYGQFSYLPLKWINFDNLGKEFDKNSVNTQSEIDKNSLGGTWYSKQFIEKSNILNVSPTLLQIYNRILSDNEEKKARKVASFYIDFFNVLKNLSRILKPNKYIVFTIGNRRVNNEVIEFNNILSEFCQNFNLTLVYDFKRNILNKRIAYKTSKLKTNESVKSIKEENILIFRKLSD